MADKKNFVVDTNIIMQNPHALLSFEDNNVIIPDVVIDELDKHKKTNGEIGANARQASRMLDAFRCDTSNGDLLKGYNLPNGGTLRVEMNCVNTEMPSTWANTPDLRILRVCKGLKEKGENVILVSNDGFVRIKASILGIEAQDYKTERAPAPDDIYSGRREAYALRSDIDSFFADKKLSPEKLSYYDDDWNVMEGQELMLHEYVVIKSSDGSNTSAIGVFDGENVVPLVNSSSAFGLQPRNVGQKFIVDALKRPASQAPLTIIKGPAGTGKTLVALAVGLEEVMDNHTYKRILYLRSNVKLDEDIGFLPGSETEKLDWALRPVRDNLEVIFSADTEPKIQNTGKSKGKKDAWGSDYDKDFLTGDIIQKDKIDEIFQRGYINIEAVGFMRGRSVADTYVIIDEAQNLTPKQIRTLLSRCSSNTKVILLGDPNQIDTPFLDSRTNGLCYAADRMAGSDTTFQITMLEDECERSELSLEVSKRMSD